MKFFGLPSGSSNGKHPWMIRKAFVMRVHPGFEEEYIRRHQPIWPELADTLLAHGVRNYSIHLLPSTQQLFAYVEYEDEARWQAIARTEICQRWWKHMSPIMPSNPDNSPVANDLTQVFRLPAPSDPKAGVQAN